MALILNGIDQWIHATWNRNQIPASIAGWFKVNTTNTSTVASFGDDTAVDSYNEFETNNGNARLVSFIAGDDFLTGDAVTTGTFAHVVAKMINNQLYLRINGGTPSLLSWGAHEGYGVVLPDFYIGRNASVNRIYALDGSVEHMAAWSSILTEEEELALYNCTTAPNEIQSANLQYYNTFVNTITPVVDNLSSTAVGLSSPTYETSGISYPSGGETWNVTYNANGADGGSVPVDGTDYNDGATVTPAGNTGNLTLSGYTFDGWALTAGGSPVESFVITADTTLYAVWAEVVPVTAITFTTTGASFAPRIEVTGTPEILWTFSDDTTSDSITPSVSFGSSATREQTLTVTPWSALVGINLGYGADDGGSAEIPMHPTQLISAIGGLDYAQDTLEYICGSGTAITSLNVSGFTSLHAIEFFQGSLTSIDVSGCSTLQRVCVESCDVATLDLTGITTIQDIRYADQGVTATLVLPATAPDLWHICVRDNVGLTMPMTLVYPALRDVWIWGCGLSGALAVESGALASLYCYDNALTSIDLSGSTLTFGCEFWGSGNAGLTTVTLPASPTFRLFDGRNCALTNANINAILDGLAGTTVEDGTVQLTGTNNGAPSSSDSINILTSRGWTVETNAVAVTYAVSDVTHDNAGNILGGCSVFLLRYAEGTLSVIGNATSDAVTGAFSIDAPDNVANYGLLSFIDGGTPRADATYPNIQPEAQ